MQHAREKVVHLDQFMTRKNRVALQEQLAALPDSLAVCKQLSCSPDN